MNDLELLAFVAIEPETDLAEHFLARITPEKRALYERMAFVCDELNAGRRPAGVIVCGEHQ